MQQCVSIRGKRSWVEFRGNLEDSGILGGGMYEFIVFKLWGMYSVPKMTREVHARVL